jgi:predicted NBD/HSP70 family sugar kinase
MTYVLFDIGGTKTRVGISSDLKTLDKVESFKTPMAFADGIKKIVETINYMTDGKKPKAIAGGIRGLLEEDKSGIHNDSVLSKWAGKSLVGELQKSFKVPIYLENDAAVAGLGEAVLEQERGWRLSRTIL